MEFATFFDAIARRLAGFQLNFLPFVQEFGIKRIDARYFPNEILSRNTQTTHIFLARSRIPGCNRRNSSPNQAKLEKTCQNTITTENLQSKCAKQTTQKPVTRELPRPPRRVHVDTQFRALCNIPHVMVRGRGFEPLNPYGTRFLNTSCDVPELRVHVVLLRLAPLTWLCPSGDLGVWHGGAKCSYAAYPRNARGLPRTRNLRLKATT
jgi:hypothetical protein